MTPDPKATPATACPHGQILRACYTCELEEQIATLEAEKAEQCKELDEFKAEVYRRTPSRWTEPCRRASHGCGQQQADGNDICTRCGWLAKEHRLVTFMCSTHGIELCTASVCRTEFREIQAEAKIAALEARIKELESR